MDAVRAAVEVPSREQRPTRGRISRAVNIPAPTGGWNARDNLAGMPVTDAVVMDNWIPDVNKVVLRSGDTSYATGLSGDVESLITHISPSAEKFLAASDGNIYDVSSGGAVGAAIGTGFANARWIWSNFNGKTILVNGADTPQSYDGSTLTSAGFSGSGLTVANLNSVTQVRDRLWFTEKDKADVWYGGIGSVTGTLTKFQLSQIATGGHCVRVGRWSRDAGDGMDDLTVFIMSTGQVITYTGDPTTTFTLNGKFMAPPPLGKRCFTTLFGDLILITRGGYVPASALLAEGDFEKLFLSNKIRDQVRRDADNYGGNFGWQVVRTPDGKFLVFNVPVTTNSEYEQHIFNLFTGAWCRFKDRDARVFGVYNNQLYFGHSTAIYRADSGLTDASRSSANIDGTTIQAFTDGGEPGKKQVALIKPIVEAGGTADISFVVKADFDTSEVSTNLQSLASSVKAWESIEVNWEDWAQNWDDGGGVIVPVLAANSLGEYHAVLARANTSSTFSWYSTGLIVKQGGLI